MSKQIMKTPLISCIVPVFNGERYLGEALESILKQTYRKFEIIIADDGSTDGTKKVAAGYSNRVQYLWQPNAGPAAARNLGVSRCDGDLVAFLDADDLWHPEKLERQVACFRARPELGYCVTYVKNFWVPELHKESERFRNHRIAKPIPGYFAGSLAVWRHLFETIGPLDVNLQHGDGTEWFLRADEKGAVGELLPDILVYRRLHLANRTRLMGLDSREEYLRIIKANLDRRRRTDSKAS